MNGVIFVDKLSEMKNQITEETAKRLIEVFTKFAAGTTFSFYGGDVDELLNTHLALIETKLRIRHLILTIKVKESSILTRWYWVKRLDRYALEINRLSALLETEANKRIVQKLTGQLN